MISDLGKSQLEFLLKDNNDPGVAKQFGVTRQAVFNLRKKFDIPSSRYDSKKRKIIVDLRCEGTSVVKISSIVQVSASYVYKILREEGYGKRKNTPDQDTQRSPVDGG